MAFWEEALQRRALSFNEHDKLYRACINYHENAQGDYIASPDILDEPLRTKEDWWRYACAQAALGDTAELADFFDPEINLMPIVCIDDAMPEEARSVVATILRNAQKRQTVGRPRLTELERRAENPIHDAYDCFRSNIEYLALHFSKVREIDRRDRALVYAARYVNENEDDYPEKILAFDRLAANDRSLLPSEQERRGALRKATGK